MLGKTEIQRINELSKKSKSDGLNSEEKQEQQELRQRYLKAVRTSLKADLMNVKIVDPEGTDVTPEKLKQAKKRYRKH